MLTHEEAREFYDRFGSRQDSQGRYEDEPLRHLIQASDFSGAHSVLEFGCGTGRFGRELLAHHLPPDARYLGMDSSSIMLDLTRRRLASYPDRVALELTDGTIRFDCPSRQFDRVVSNYVLDLLCEGDIIQFLDESARVLAPKGRLCVVNLTPGLTWFTRITSSAWSLVHRISPRIVGGCRPLDVLPLLQPSRWDVLFEEVVVAGGLASQVLVASPRCGEDQEIDQGAKTG